MAENFLDFNYERFLKHKKNFIFRYKGSVRHRILNSFIEKHPNEKIAIYTQSYLANYLDYANVVPIRKMFEICDKDCDILIIMTPEEYNYINQIEYYLKDKSVFIADLSPL